MNENRDAVFAAVSQIVRRSLKGSAATAMEIRPETSLLDDLNLDSLTMVDVVLDVEDEFKIKINEAETQEAFTVNDLRELVLRKSRQKAL